MVIPRPGCGFAPPDTTESDSTDDDDEKDDSVNEYDGPFDHDDSLDSSGVGRRRKKKGKRSGMYLRSKAPLEINPDRPML